MKTLTKDQLICEVILALGLEACKGAWTYISEEHDDCHNYGNIVSENYENIASFSYQWEVGCEISFGGEFGSFEAEVEHVDVILEAMNVDFLKGYQRLSSNGFFEKYLEERLEDRDFFDFLSEEEFEEYISSIEEEEELPF